MERSNGSQNYSFYNGDIDLPRVNKFSSPDTSPRRSYVQNHPFPANRNGKNDYDADSSNMSGDDKLSPKSDDFQKLFIPHPPAAPKTRTKIVKAQVHHLHQKRSNKVLPHDSSTDCFNRLPPIESKKTKNIIRVEEENKVHTDNIVKTDRHDIVTSPRPEKSDPTDNGLQNDHHLINKYKEFINKRYTEETFQENLNNSSSSSDDDLSVSVSSLSGNDDDIGDIAEKTLTSFEPMYSLPIKKQQLNAADKMFNKIVISRSSCDNACHKKSYGSLPDLRSMETVELKKVSHVLKNESEAESEPGAQIRYKFKPLPPIPGTTSNINNTGLYETIDGLSKLHKSSHDNTSERQPNKRKTFKEIASILTLVPRLTTNSVRSRKNDHSLADICQYLPDKKLKIFVGTWNMKGTKFLPSALDDFLLPPESIYLQDIYVIGTQEGTPFRHEWQVRLQETFGPSHVLMQASNFGVLQLSVFVRRELVWFCSGVEQDTIATRMGHKIKTKGALAMSFSVFGTSLLFITSHFTSDKEKLDDRLNDYRTIRQSLNLPFSDVKNDEKDVTNRFDRVFWFGDFNFRIEKPRKYVDNILKKYAKKNEGHQYEALNQHLMQFDQLNALLKKGKIFHGFTESPVHFMPTYKFDVNTSTYDTSSKQRVPSWTDRILHKTRASPASLTCLYYNSCNSITVSDHRSVYGIFETEVEPYKDNFTAVHGANFNREVYVEANLRRNAPNGTQSNSHICTIL